MRPSALLLAAVCWGSGLAPAFAAPVPMEELVRRALSQAPALQAAEAAAAAQAASEGVARSSYLPQVNLSAGLSQTTSASPTQTTAQPFTFGNAGLAVRQSLWTFGKRGAAVDQAVAATAAARAQAELRAVEVAYGVRQAYLNWAQAAGLEAQAVEQVRLAELTRREAQARFQAGLTPQLDVTRAQAAHAQAQAALAAAKAAAAQAQRSVATAIGQAEPVAGEPIFPAEPAWASRPLSEFSAAAAEHPALQAVSAQVEQASAARRLAAAGGNPDLAADASYGLRARDFVGAPNWQAGLSLSWPLYAPAVSRQVSAAESQEASQAALLASRRLEVSRDVDNAYLALSGAKERLPAAQTALAAARANQAQAQGRYQAGVGAIIEVADAQSLVASAHAEWVRAQAGYHLAIAELQRAMGQTGVSR